MDAPTGTRATPVPANSNLSSPARKPRESPNGFPWEVNAVYRIYRRWDISRHGLAPDYNRCEGIRCRHASTTVGCAATFFSSLASSITDGRASRSIGDVALISSLNAVSTVGCVDYESSRFWSGARLLCHLFLPSHFCDGLDHRYSTWHLIGLGICRSLPSRSSHKFTGGNWL
jgi:hypothetical protein